jgi:hypothetical protein
VGGCRFDGGAVLVRHVSVALRLTLLQRNSLARSRVRKRSFIITKSRICFQSTVDTSEIVVRRVSFQIHVLNLCYYNILGPRSLACSMKSLGEARKKSRSRLFPSFTYSSRHGNSLFSIPLKGNGRFYHHESLTSVTIYSQRHKLSSLYLRPWL